MKKRNKPRVLKRSNTESNLNSFKLKLVFKFKSGRTVSKLVFPNENIEKLELFRAHFIQKEYMNSNEIFYYEGKEIITSSNLEFDKIFPIELKLNSQNDIIVKPKPILNKINFRIIRSELVSDKLKDIPKKFYQYSKAKEAFSFSEENKSKTIMVIGKTGEGKTSFINGLLNYINQVNYNSKERYLIVNEKTGREDTESQTSDIQLFYIHSINKNIPPIKIIDTPGISDTRGINLDKKTIKILDKFLLSKKVPKINNIFFFINSTFPRLTSEVIYIYHTILSIFPKSFMEKISFIFTKNGDENNIKQLLEILDEKNSGFEKVCFKIKQQKNYYFHLFQDLLKVNDETEWNKLINSYKEITDKIILSQDLYLKDFEPYSRLKKRYNLFIDNILNLDDYIKEKIVNELERIKNEITSTEKSVKETNNYKSENEIIECVDCLKGINLEYCYQCMICKGTRVSCKVSKKRETTIPPGSNICSECNHLQSDHEFSTKKYDKKKIEKIIEGVKEENEKAKKELNSLINQQISLNSKKQSYQNYRKQIIGQVKYTSYNLWDYEINHKNEQYYIKYYEELIKGEEIDKNENSDKIINCYQKHISKYKLMEEIENSNENPIKRDNLFNIPFTKNDNTHNFILFSNNIILKQKFMENLLTSVVEELNDEEKKSIKNENKNEYWKILNIRAYLIEEFFQIYIANHTNNVDDVLNMLKEINNISVKTIVFLFEEKSSDFNIFFSFMERMLKQLYVYDKILIVFYNYSNKVSTLSISLYNKEQILNKITYNTFLFSIDNFLGISGFKKNIEFTEFLNIIINFNGFKLSNFLMDLF